MKIAGIIAEYNPFHTGHAYHIQKTRELTGADYIVVVMSGDFVQRGAPALCSKHLRTRMALLGGADLVFELPATMPARVRNSLRRVPSDCLTDSAVWMFFLLEAKAETSNRFYSSELFLPPRRRNIRIF